MIFGPLLAKLAIPFASILALVVPLKLLGFADKVILFPSRSKTGLSYTSKTEITGSIISPA